MVIAGIFAGLAGVVWSIAAGLPMLVTVLLYPAAGIAGCAVFLTAVLMWPALAGTLQPVPSTRETN